MGKQKQLRLNFDAADRAAETFSVPPDVPVELPEKNHPIRDHRVSADPAWNRIQRLLPKYHGDMKAAIAAFQAEEAAKPPHKRKLQYINPPPPPSPTR
ncbi:MAG: hypothetical protein PHW10_05565 [Candidatus Peribacteraceae bacterium]|nr:hypothetical protein [Candidatus Peribacteraceae bacterium]